MPSIFRSLGKASVTELTNLLACAAAAAGAGLSIFVWNPAGFLSSFFFLSFCALSLISAWVIWAPDKEPSSRLAWKWVLVYLVFTALALYSRFRGIGELALWADEDNQDWFLFRKLEIAQRAAWAQQPALHHFLSLPLVKELGNKLLAIRFYPALFGALAVPLFLSLLLQTCRSKFFAVLGTILFLGNNWLISFAKEGKPNSMAVFFTVLYLHALLGLVRAHAADSRARLRAWLTLFVTSVLLFSSIGIQPLLVGEAFTLALPLLYFRSRDRELSFLVAGASLLAVAMVGPFLYETYWISRQFGYIKSNGVLYFFREEFLSQWWVSLRVWRDLLTGLFLIVLLPVGIFLAWLRKERFPLLCMIASLLLPILGLLTYGLIARVNMPVPRYFLVFLPVWVAAIAYTLDLIFTRGLMAKGAAVAAACFAVFGAWISYSMPTEKVSETQIPELYQYFRKENLRNAQAFYVTLNRLPLAPDRSTQVGFHGKDYYYGDLGSKVILESLYDNTVKYGNQLDRLFVEIERNPEASDIFFYSLSRENDAPWDQYSYSAGNQPEFIFLGDGYPRGWASSVLIRLRNRLGFRETVKRFFLDLDKEEKDPVLKQKAIAVLAVVAMAEKKCAVAQQYRQRLLPICYENIGTCVAREQMDQKFKHFCP